MEKEGAQKPAPAPIHEILREDSAARKPESAHAEAKKPMPEQMPLSASVPTEEKSDAPKEAEAAREDKPALHDAKLRQIEELLRRRSEESPADGSDDGHPAEESGRNAKLREIEELLRKNGGGQTLSEALHNAIRS